MKRTHLLKKDSAVAVIIGALLTFVIVASLLSAYVLWYVPANGQQLDIQYISDSENSFLRLQNEISNSTPYPNEFVTQSFSLGIAGTPPFSSSTDSTIGYANGSSFSTNLNYSLIVTVTYNKITRSIPINVNFNGSGQIYLDTQTPFTTSTNIYFQSDTVLLQQFNSNYSNTVGSLPLSVGKNSSGNASINASQFMITGQSTSEGTYGATLLTLQYSDVNQSNFYVGENVTVSNLTGGYTTAVVDSIALNSFYYNVTSTQIFAWNSALASIYNSTVKSSPGSESQMNWHFSNFNFVNVTYSPKQGTLSVYTTQPIHPYSVNLGFFILKMLQI